MELMIASGKAVPKLQLEHGLAVDRVYTGSFMTSLDMAGLDLRMNSKDNGVTAFLKIGSRMSLYFVKESIF